MGAADSPQRTAETGDISAPADEANASAQSDTKKLPVHSFFGY